MKCASWRTTLSNLFLSDHLRWAVSWTGFSVRVVCCYCSWICVERSQRGLWLGSRLLWPCLWVGTRLFPRINWRVNLYISSVNGRPRFREEEESATHVCPDGNCSNEDSNTTNVHDLLEGRWQSCLFVTERAFTQSRMRTSVRPYVASPAATTFFRDHIISFSFLPKLVVADTSPPYHCDCCTFTMAPTPAQAKAIQARKLQGKQPKARVQRYLKKTSAQLKETGKNALLLKGISCSQQMAHVLQELRAMQAPNAKLLSKKNQIIPFSTEGQQSLEFLTTKNDCALFAVASSNKKRPANLIMGRTFDHQILDLAELNILRFKSMKDYGGQVPKKKIGSKPLLLFVGDTWDQQEDYRNLRSLLTDFYRGDVVDKVVFSGLDHLIVFTLAAAPVSGTDTTQFLVHQRTYFCQVKKSAQSQVPVPALQNCGPDLDLRLGRTQWAEPDLYKAARVLPSGLKRKKVKNQSTNLFGERIGRLHLTKQNVDTMGGRKVKALRRAEKAAADTEKQAVEEELAQEKQAMDQEFEQTYGFQPDSQ